MMDIKVVILQWFNKFFDKKSLATRDKSASDGAVKNENMSNKELEEELHKSIIRKFKERKLYSSFIENIWGADLANMQLISKFNKEIHFSFCA